MDIIEFVKCGWLEEPNAQNYKLPQTQSATYVPFQSSGTITEGEIITTNI